MSDKKFISDELLAAFIEGKTSSEEEAFIIDYLKSDPSALEEFRISFMAANILEEPDIEDETDDMHREGNLISPLILGGAAGSIFGHSFGFSSVPMAAKNNIENYHSDDRNQDNDDSIIKTESITDNDNIMRAQNLGFTSAPKGFGKPALEETFNPNTYQFYGDTCAIQSQRIVLRDYGINLTQEQLINEAKMHGWYIEGQGTPFDKVGKLLDLHGIPCDQTIGGNIFNIANELAQGHKVIVAVDSSELSQNAFSRYISDLFGPGADHALVVAGIDVSNPKDPKVILTDPGTGQTQVTITAQQFNDAWEDSNCFMVSTTEPPINLPSMKYFDYQVGHIGEWAGMNYSDLSTLSDAELYLPEKPFDEILEQINSGKDIDSIVDQYSKISTDVDLQDSFDTTNDIENDIQDSFNSFDESGNDGHHDGSVDSEIV